MKKSIFTGPPAGTNYINGGKMNGLTFEGRSVSLAKNGDRVMQGNGYSQKVMSKVTAPI
jgi:hypothetical protein